MNLLMLAPEIQEELLFLPRVEAGRDELCLRELQGVASVVEWRGQRAVMRATGKLNLDKSVGVHSGSNLYHRRLE